jgi:hypothetical protein
MANNSEKTEQVERLEEEKSQVVDPAQVKYARQQFQKMMLEHLARDMARAGKFINLKELLKIVKVLYSLSYRLCFEYFSQFKIDSET